jgi:hypothetical protein
MNTKGALELHAFSVYSKTCDILSYDIQDSAPEIPSVAYKHKIATSDSSRMRCGAFYNYNPAVATKPPEGGLKGAK